jgi:dihydroorotate dehydrogenase
MVYKGPGIVRSIKKELIDILKKEKIKNIQQAIGINS